VKIEIVSYRTSWATDFEIEKAVLLEEIGEVICEIHHIGSTSVKGLADKPIIDILISAISLEGLDSNANKFERFGYEVLGEFGIKGRRYYRKGVNTRTHQVHAFEKGDSNLLRHLAFRNYLEANPRVMEDYQNLKRKLAIEYSNDLDAYCDGKDHFIKYYESKAVVWAEGTEH
jgi:GrpB-like predicted nucleotidyltransferase (UPF0157 family)